MERMMHAVIKNHYAIYSGSPYFDDVLDWIKDNKIPCEFHLNRTRFWVPDGILFTEFLLKYSDVCTKMIEIEEGFDATS
jgi:hypothetical protein